MPRRTTAPSSAPCSTNTASSVWADTAYRSKANEAHLAENGLRSKIHFRRKPGRDLPPSQKKANRARSKVRSAVESVFAAEKHVFGLFIPRALKAIYNVG